MIESQPSKQRTRRRLRSLLTPHLPRPQPCLSLVCPCEGVCVWRYIYHHLPLFCFNANLSRSVLYVLGGTLLSRAEGISLAPWAVLLFPACPLRVAVGAQFPSRDQTQAPQWKHRVLTAESQGTPEGSALWAAQCSL